MCLTLRPYGLKYARLSCPSLSPGVCLDSRLLNRWCHPTISSFAIPFSSCLQSFPASGSFPMSKLFTSGGLNMEASASASVLPMNIQGWYPLGLTGLISLQSKGLSRVFSNTNSSKASILQCSAFFMIQLSHLYMTTRKTIALTTLTFASKVSFLHTLKCENHCLRGFLCSNKFEKQVLCWKEPEDLIWGQALALPLNNPELLLWDAWK